MLKWAENGKFGGAKMKKFVGNFSGRRVVPYAEVDMTANEKTIKLVGVLIWAVNQILPMNIKKEFNRRLDEIFDSPTDEYIT